MHDMIEFVGGTKQERAVNSENCDVGWNRLVLKAVITAVLNIFRSNARDLRGGCNFPNENQRGENHSGFDGYGEVGENRQRKSDQPGSNFQARELQKFGNLAPLAHV